MRQRSVLAILVVLVSLLAAMPADARDQSRPRKAEAPYQTPVVGARIAGAFAAYSWDCEGQMKMGCAVFELKRGDRFASFEVRDAGGLPVFARVFDQGDWGQGQLLGEFCGKTSERIDVRRTSLALVHIVAGTCDDRTPSTPTSGVVQAKFFRSGGDR